MRFDLELRHELSAEHVGQLMELYSREWWTRTRRPQDVQQMLASTDLIFAWIDRAPGQLVAFARVLTDRTYIALILDMIVRPDHRGRGLGQQLMAQLCEHPELRRVASIELVCQLKRMDFYRRCGFTERVGGSTLMRRTTESALLGDRADQAP